MVKREFNYIDALENWAIHSEYKLPTDNNNHFTLVKINQLEQELEEAKLAPNLAEQSLRENVLLDRKTGIATRQTFDNHLTALLKEADTYGVVMLIQLRACELIQNLYGENEAITVLEQAIDSVNNRIADYSDCLISRRNEFELAVLIPAIYSKQAEKLAERILVNLLSIPLPVGINKDDFCHIGLSYFTADKQLYQIMAETDMALRSAQLHGPAQWFMFETGEVIKDTAMGSLKWRTLLIESINKKAFVLFSQQVISTKDNNILHYEMLSKLKNKTN